MRSRRPSGRSLAAVFAAAAQTLSTSAADAQQRPAERAPEAEAPASSTRVAGWVTIGAGATLTSVGGLFLGMAMAQTARLDALAAMRDPSTGLPLVQYSDIQMVEAQRSVDIGFCVGFFAVGTAALVTGTVLALLPGRASRSVVLAPTWGGAIVRFTF